MTALLIVAAVAAVVLLAILGFALHETSVARKEREKLLALRPEAASQHAAANVVQARNQFSLAVEAYELGMANAEQSVRVAEPAGALFGSGGADTSTALPPADPRLAQLEQNKELARNQLLDAQRLWEAVRPPDEADASVELWAGCGVMRGWQIGPIGFERAFIRCEHVLDPSCWAAWEVKRLRWGLAVGAESQRLALYAAAVPTARMAEIVGQGMGGGEVAARPGFSPQRWWRRRRRMPAPRRATSTLLQTMDVAEGPDDPTRQAVRKAFEVEMGQPVDQVGSLGDMDGVLSVLAAGPSVVFGAWFGREPKAHLLAGSAHTAWRTAE